MHNSKPSSLLLVLALIAGSQTVLGKFALERMPTFGYTALRFSLAYLIVIAALLVTGRKLPWKKVVPFAPVAVLWILSGMAFIMGLQRTDATTTQFIHTSIPIITAIAAGLILQHRLRKAQWLGVAIAFVGVVLVILSEGGLSLQNASFLGNVLVFASAVGFALYAVLTRLPKFREIEPLETIFIGFTFGVPMIAPFAMAEFLHSGNWLPGVSPSAWAAVVLATIAFVFFATIFQILINRAGPSYASLNQYLNPVFVIFWAAILLNETPEALALAGGAIALAGVALVSWHQRKDDIETTVRATTSAD